ncbi:MAG: triose-phosphate isomerase [Bacteroidetes bacterium GWF2_33_16]|nr:MAG: triose-phosphate isomerase [Bacteroidetes bacterium GWE2_32_14]OFY07287.1 MAG: triose-phosphate isomerase [Bacteroidetes bacterium GWF2_33_16]
MRKKIVAGNWKMNTTLPNGLSLVSEIIKSQDVPKDVVLIVAPPYTHLSDISKILKNTSIKLAAQNCAQFDQGAYTGEIAATILKSVGTEYVILGHSERRAYYAETDLIINSKIKLALAAGIKPIVCCGEVLEEREKGIHFDIVAKQLKGMFEGISPEQFKEIIIAYEPVWAIGTGKTATPAQAQEIHAFIRINIEKVFGTELAHNMPILYGGSCKPSNAKELFANPDVDGGLIGGASLVAKDFIDIAKSF